MSAWTLLFSHTSFLSPIVQKTLFTVTSIVLTTLTCADFVLISTVYSAWSAFFNFFSRETGLWMTRSWCRSSTWTSILWHTFVPLLVEQIPRFAVTVSILGTVKVKRAGGRRLLILVAAGHVAWRTSRLRFVRSTWRLMWNCLSNSNDSSDGDGDRQYTDHPVLHPFSLDDSVKVLPYLDAVLNHLLYNMCNYFPVFMARFHQRFLAEVLTDTLVYCTHFKIQIS